jgi:3-deoxy-D-manno-octulosonic acid kinase
MIRGYVPSYEKVCRGNRTALVRAEWAACIAAALLEGEGCAEFGEGGRGMLQRFAYADGYGLIRKYRRGGFIRHFLADAYILDNRAARELSITDYLREKGLPVPMPLGACWQYSGILYRGSIATQLLDAADLRDYLANDPAAPEDTMRRAGEWIRRMHDFGVFHADLQVHNILVTPQQQVYLIDFDKARSGPSLSQVQRARNLLRFRRSLEKNNLPIDLFRPLCEGYGVNSLPAWLTRAYQLKAKLSDAISGNEAQPYTIAHRPSMTLYLRPGLSADTVLDALKIPGEPLKTSPKSTTSKIPTPLGTPISRLASEVGEFTTTENQPKTSPIQNPQTPNPKPQTPFQNPHSHVFPCINSRAMRLPSSTPGWSNVCTL